MLFQIQKPQLTSRLFYFSTSDWIMQPRPSYCEDTASVYICRDTVGLTMSDRLYVICWNLNLVLGVCWTNVSTPTLTLCSFAQACLLKKMTFFVWAMCPLDLLFIVVHRTSNLLYRLWKNIKMVIFCFKSAREYLVRVETGAKFGPVLAANHYIKQGGYTCCFQTAQIQDGRGYRTFWSVSF